MHPSKMILIKVSFATQYQWEKKLQFKLKLKRKFKEDMNIPFKQKNQLYLQCLEFAVNIALCTEEHLIIKYPITKQVKTICIKMHTDGK